MTHSTAHSRSFNSLEYMYIYTTLNLIRPHCDSNLRVNFEPQADRMSHQEWTMQQSRHYGLSSQQTHTLNAGPTLKQHCFSVSCLLGCHICYLMKRVDILPMLGQCRRRCPTFGQCIEFAGMGLYFIRQNLTSADVRF